MGGWARRGPEAWGKGAAAVQGLAAPCSRYALLPVTCGFWNGLWTKLFLLKDLHYPVRDGFSSFGLLVKPVVLGLAFFAPDNYY